MEIDRCTERILEVEKEEQCITEHPGYVACCLDSWVLLTAAIGLKTLKSEEVFRDYETEAGAAESEWVIEVILLVLFGEKPAKFFFFFFHFVIIIFLASFVLPSLFYLFIHRTQETWVFPHSKEIPYSYMKFSQGKYTLKTYFTAFTKAWSESLLVAPSLLFGN